MPPKQLYNFKLVQEQIGKTRTLFENKLQSKLNLIRVSAPLIVAQASGLNDKLSGVEQAVEFHVPDLNKQIEIVQSLAKWKRVAIKHYEIPNHEGLYADMNALRKDEVLDAIHSIYVDQWDWEVRIAKHDRTVEMLTKYVKAIHHAFYETQIEIQTYYKIKSNPMPNRVFFITSQKLAELYPNLNGSQREYEIVKMHKAVFIIGIGWTLSDGQPHGTRSPDYDDWNLNGDLILWNETIQQPFELSSMGIRVDKTALMAQLTATNNLDRMQYQYHQDIINENLPFTIGGGIGQSRLCMFILGKQHIGEVQCSVWDDNVLNNKDWNIL